MTALDDNDLLRGGQFPADPAEGCGPAEPPCACGGKGRGYNGFHYPGALGCRANTLDALAPPKPRAPRDKAPDGAPWPLPRIAVDTREQRPWHFGWRETIGQEDPRAWPLKGADPESLVTGLLEGPWHTESATLGEGDYQLLGPDGALLEGVAAVERKSMADLRGSLSAGHDRLMREMERMAPWTTPVLIVEAPVEVLLGARSGLVEVLESCRASLVRTAALLLSARFAGIRRGLRENATAIADVLGSAPEDAQRPGRVSHRALLGSALSILTDHRIPVLFLPSREWAEYAAAWILRRAWRRWLADDPARLAAERGRGRAAA